MTALSEDPCAPLPTEIEIMRGHSLFHPLSQELQEAIWSSGKVFTYAKDSVVDIRSPLVEFLNFVLSGELAVEALQMDQNTRVRRAGSKFIFGTIDSFLGTGRFLRAKALSDSRIFTLNRARLLELLYRFPEFIPHFAKLRLGIAMRMAEMQERTLEEKSSIPPRVAMRFPAAGLHLLARVEGEVDHPVENLSETGLFVRGIIPSSLGDRLSFTLRSPETEELELTGRVVRKTSEGTGLAIDDLEEQARNTWSDLVQRVRCVRIDQLLRPQLTRLSSPFRATLIGSKTTVDGSIVELSLEGALFRAPVPLQGKVILTDNETFRIPAEVVESKGKNEIILFFPRLDPREENSIGQLIAGGNVIDLVTPIKPESPAVGANILRRQIIRKGDFCRMYFQELAEQTVCAQTTEPLHIGDPVEVHISVDPNEIPIPRSRCEIIFRGKVSRLSHLDVVVAIDRADLTQIKDIKALVNSISQTESRQGIRRAVHQEQNIKHRRHWQLWLILCLLAGVILWVLYGPHPDLP